MHRTTSLLTATILAVAGMVIAAGPAAAQQPPAQEPGSRAEEQAREQEKKAQALRAYTRPWIERQLLAIEDAGGFGVARGVIAVFGDIKRGSGISLGPAYGKTFASGAVFRAKGEYSLKSYKLLQTSWSSPPLANGRIALRARARWQDAPKGGLFPLGPDSSNLRARYAETRTEVSAAAAFAPVRLLRFEAGAASERYDTDLPELPRDPGAALQFQGAPGLGADPKYVHAYGSAALDSRDGPGYSRRGSQLGATLHDYRDRNGPYSFQRVDGVAEQYVPILQGNWVFYVGLHASTTSTTNGHDVPFFLMPDLGGHDLRGFVDYRFRDRHALLVTAEYRWYAQEYLDGAIFYDAGKVVPDRSALDFTGLQSSVGAGIRLHSSQSTALRLEVAHSREGLRFIMAFSAAGG